MLNISRKGRSSVNVVSPIVQNLKNQKKFNHTNPPRSGGGGGGKFLVATTGLGVAGAGGVLLYSYVDPSFRANVESNFPFTAPLYKSILGDSSHALVVPSPFAPSDKIKILLPSKRNEKKNNNNSPNIDETPLPESGADSSKQVLPIKSILKPENPYLGSDDAEKKNKALVQHLKVALASAGSKVSDATNAKDLSISSLEKHSKVMKETIDAGPNANLDSLVHAHKETEIRRADDMQAEKAARAELEKLAKIIELGSQGETTADNALLKLAEHTLDKLTNQLAEKFEKLNKVVSDGILIREYAHLVEEGRKQFTSELKAMIPNADWDVEVGKMKEDQVGAVLIHAHRKVDQLNRQLILQKMEEEKRVKELLEQKKLETMSQVLESAKQSGENPEATDKLATFQLECEQELQAQLQIIKDNYEKELKMIVHTQKQLYDLEHAKDLDEAVQAERSVHYSKFGVALSQLEGIEKALSDRVVMDADNRRSKQVWLAVQNLVDSIIYGKRSSCCIEGRRLPLKPQLDDIMKHSKDDDFMNVLVQTISDESKVKGEYTTEDLKNRIEKAIKVSHRVAGVDENGGGLAAHILSYVRSLLHLRLPVKYTDKDKFDPIAESNESLLGRAAYYVQHGQLLEAIKILQYVRGPAREIAQDVIRDTRRHEETLLIARLMLAHAAVTSMRATY